MDDSGVHLDRDDSQTCHSGSFSGSLSMACESFDDCRFEVSFDSSLDITCWEPATFWTPTPRLKKPNKSRKKSSAKSDKQKRIIRTAVRRSERLRQKSQAKYSAANCCMSISPIRPLSPFTPVMVASRCNEVIVYDYTDKRSLVGSELAFEDFGFHSYEDVLYEHRKNSEDLYHPADSLACQPKVTVGLRAILVEWMTKMHHRLDLKIDTLFLSVNVVDRFLITTPISINCIQLLGITSTLVACKMNEIFPPTICELLVMSSEAYTQVQVKQLERLVLTRLRFNLLAPTSIFFLEYHVHTHMRTSCFVKSDMQNVKRARLLARHMLELSLQEYNSCQFAPSLLSLVALCQADIILCQNTRYVSPESIGYDVHKMKDCADKLQPIVDGIMENTADFDDIFKKYAQAYGNDEQID